MKIKIFLPLILVLVLLSCSKSDNKQNRNPYLTNAIVSLNLNLNLPEYNQLKYPGSYIVVAGGIKGIVVYCVSETFYLAFDLSDPNHVPNSCSRMELDGIIAVCPCTDDDNEYFITSGQHRTEPDTKYAMQQYRAERSGNSIFISN